MNLVAALVGAAGGEHEDITQTPSKFWPEGYEMLFGIPASLLVFFLLWKFAGPAVKKAMAARTAKVQAELDAGEAARAAAEAEAAEIRKAKGDIAAERERLLAEAEAQSAAVLEDGRARLAQELTELETRAEADVAAAAARIGDELRAEIARLSVAAVDHVVTGSLDDATQQELIESFIAAVGAGASV
ncbi:MAG: F-type H+-transporting ATPase subunit b [Ilumatobacteraceae bacterium]|jgi:F-type H+-transporting ATPase subunit b